MKDYVNRLMENDAVKTISLVIAVVGVIIAILVSLGFVSALLAFVVVAIIIIFGSLRELAGSIIIVFLTKMLLSDIRELIGIWIASPRLNKLYFYIESTGYVKLVFILFLGVFIISFLTGLVKVFNIKVENKNSENKSPGNKGLKIKI
jgi:multisubunit Na+/H+ antiporter MnhG subunit